jgi:peptidoglycan/xylan/chitin deacetylase (PgdA/CDA1 family)
MPLTRLEKSLARTLLHEAGWLRGVRYWNRRGFRILMYHDFPSNVPGLPEALRRQCAHINRYYNVVSMTEIARHLREGTRLPPNALAVTVDDGNRDFLLNGYPVFYAHHIPVTVFLVSGFLDGKLWLWWDQISYLVEKSRRKSFEVRLFVGESPVKFTLETAEQRQHALSTITEAMKEVGASARMDVVNSLPRLLDVELPKDAPSHMAPLEWPEVRDLAQKGVDFGAHTVTHPVLSRIADPAELVEEIERSKQRIEQELGRPVLHFCYPYGRREDFNDETVKVVGQCQFLTAVTAQPGLNFHTTHPFRLRRLSAEPTMPEFYFKESLAGLHDR